MEVNKGQGKILVVDDTPSTIGILSESLESEGFQVFIATSGDKAISRSESVLPDLILLDVMMPGIDGFETCRRLKKNEKVKDIPVLFMTGLTAIANKVQGFQAGAVDYVTKPIEIAEVLSRIKTHIALKNIRKDILEKNELLQKEITERKLAEERIRELNSHLEKRVADRTAELACVNRMLTILSECNQILVRAQNEGELLNNICKIIVGQGGYGFAQVAFSRDESFSKLSIAAEQGKYLTGSASDVILSDTELETLRLAGFFSGKPFITCSYNNVPHNTEINMSGTGTFPGSYISIPIFIGKKIIGFLKIHSPNQDAFNSDEIELLKELGSDLAFGIKLLNDRKELEQTEKELRENKLLFDEISEQSQVIVWSIDTEGLFTFVSDTCGSVWGYTHDEIVGKMKFIDLIPEKNREAEVEYSKGIASRKARIRDKIYRIHKKNGEIIHVSAYAYPIFDDSGNYYGYRGSIINVTERQIMIDELIVAKKMAEEANTLKSTLLANMSHEFRTPLNGILGFAQLLEDELNGASYVETVRKITRSGKRLMNTLNSVLTLIDLEQKNFNVNIAPVDLRTICLRIQDSYMSFAEEKNLNIELAIDTLHTQILTDESLLKKLISYLVENAIKYTFQGVVKILVMEELNAAGREQICIHIIDTGIGIKPEYQTVIFEEFRQASEGIRRAFEGLGLGLTLAKRVASLIDADILLKSELGGGSDFVIKLPLSVQASSKLSLKELKMPSEAKNSGIDKAKCDILLVEDNLLNIEVIIRFLSDRGNVTYAQDGLKAIELAQQNNYAIILIDINLGRDMDGTEVLKHLKTFDKYKNTPMVAITGYASEFNKKEFLEKGFTGYLAKPFDKGDLVDLVDDLLNRSIL
jgi:PAS domain S-box-containing protein